MFNFRLINTQDGNQIIDTTLKTPYNSLTPVEMLEYIEVDERLEYMKRIERRQRKEAQKHRGLLHRIIKNVACICNIAILE